MPTAGPDLNPEAVRAIREKSGLSVAKCSAAIGVSAAHLTNVEQGRRGLSHEAVTRLTRVLAVPLAAIVIPPCPECAKAAS